METSSRPLSFLKKKKKASNEIKASDQQLSFNIFRWPSTWMQ